MLYHLDQLANSVIFPHGTINSLYSETLNDICRMNGNHSIEVKDEVIYKMKLYFKLKFLFTLKFGYIYE